MTFQWASFHDNMAPQGEHLDFICEGEPSWPEHLQLGPTYNTTASGIKMPVHKHVEHIFNTQHTNMCVNIWRT